MVYPFNIIVKCTSYSSSYPRGGRHLGMLHVGEDMSETNIFIHPAMTCLHTHNVRYIMFTYWKIHHPPLTTYSHSFGCKSAHRLPSEIIRTMQNEQTHTIPESVFMQLLSRQTLSQTSYTLWVMCHEHCAIIMLSLRKVYGYIRLAFSVYLHVYQVWATSPVGSICFCRQCGFHRIAIYLNIKTRVMITV